MNQEAVNDFGCYVCGAPAPDPLKPHGRVYVLGVVDFRACMPCRDRIELAMLRAASAERAAIRSRLAAA